MRDPVMQFWAQVVQDLVFCRPEFFHRALVRRRAAVMGSTARINETVEAFSHTVTPSGNVSGMKYGFRSRRSSRPATVSSISWWPPASPITLVIGALPLDDDPADRGKAWRSCRDRTPA
jgi:hypothetical protein